MFRIDWKLPLLLALASCVPARSNMPPHVTNEKADGSSGPLFPDDPVDGGAGVDLRVSNACNSAKAEASPAKKPVDIIVMIDNSGSMRDEIMGVEKQLNVSLAALLAEKKVDYHLIVISSYGYHDAQMVCIAQPLSGNTCLQPIKGPPANTDRFFHYDVNVQSNDAFNKALMGYRSRDLWNLAPGGWQAWLRRDSMKMFLIITDDAPTMTGADFDFQLRAMDAAQFGNDKKRNYVFHSIVGVTENMPATKAYAPQDPIVAQKCKTAENNGEEYQNLSKLTGGLRYPVCQSNSYDAIFQEITKGVVEGAKLACEILVPQVPKELEGQAINYDTLTVEFTDSMLGNAVNFKKVSGPGACQLDSFYVTPAGCENVLPAGNCERIVLCPDTCGKVQRDLNATMRLLYDCILIGG